MQSIERYGVVALLFLLVTVAAVLMWSGDEDPKGNERERTVAQTPVNPRAGNGDGVVSSRTQSGRNEPLTDESARQRSQREAALLQQQERDRRDQQQLDRYGVPSGGSGVVPGGDTQAAGIVPGGSGDERGGYGTEPGSGGEIATLDDGGEAQRAAEQALELERQAEDAAAARAREAARRNNRSGRSSGGVPVYVVKKNEVLGVIAQQQLGSVRNMQDIIDANPGLNPDRIREGMELRMPAGWAGGGTVASPSASAPAATRRQAATAPAGTHAYVVQEGESLWRIAEARLGSGARYTEIEAANPNLNNGAIRAGQTIYLPGASSTPARSTRPTVATAVPNSGNRTRRGVR